MEKAKELGKERKSWNKWRKERTDDTWREYIEARNECVKVMREEKHEYKKDIMEE